MIPENVYLPAETTAVLDRFVKGGGTISHTAYEACPVVKTEGDIAGLRVTGMCIRTILKNGIFGNCHPISKRNEKLLRISCQADCMVQ